MPIEKLLHELLRLSDEDRPSRVSTFCPITRTAAYGEASLVTYLVIGIFWLFTTHLAAQFPLAKDLIERWRYGLTYMFIPIVTLGLGEWLYRGRLRRWCLSALTSLYRKNALLFIREEILLKGRLNNSHIFRAEDLLTKHMDYMLPRELVNYILSALERHGYINMVKGSRLYLKPTSKLVQLARKYRHMTVL